MYVSRTEHNSEALDESANSKNVVCNSNLLLSYLLEQPSRFIKYATSYCCKINCFSVGKWLITIKCCENSSEYYLLICLIKKAS